MMRESPCSRETSGLRTFLMNVRVDDLKALPLKQRIKLVEDLWDSIAAELDKQPVPEDVKAEMRRRRDEYVKDPSTGVDWDVTRRRLEKPK